MEKTVISTEEPCASCPHHVAETSLITEEKSKTKPGSYEPNSQRIIKNPISSAEALILLLKGALGSGVLSSVLIFKEGWLTGIIYTCIIGALVTHCLHILIRTQYRLCKSLKISSMTYSEAVKNALKIGPVRLRGFHKYAPFVVDGSLLLGQFAICTTYALFVLQTFGFFEEYTPWLHIGLKRYVYSLILMIPFAFVVFMGNWKIVTYFSSIANLFSLAAIFITFSYLVVDLKPMSELKALGNIYQFPKFFGPVLFSLEAVSVVSTFEDKLKQPKQLINRFGVLNLGMTLITVIYILMGLLGYFRYGELAVGSFLNDTPLRDTASIWCRTLYTLAIYLTYGLHGFVLVEVLWQKKLRGHQSSFKHVFRILFVVGSTMIITFIPFIVRTVILDAMFAVSLPALAIILPALIEFCEQWPRHHKNRTRTLWKDTVLITFGFLDMLAGLYFCIEQLIDFFVTRKPVIFW